MTGFAPWRNLGQRGASRLTSLFSLTGVFAGTASACAGGVCAAAAPATAGFLGGFGATASMATLAAGHFTATATAKAANVPWLNWFSLFLLGAVLLANVWMFSRKHRPARAILLGLAYGALVPAETWRYPGIHPQSIQWAVLALALPFFLALPTRGNLSRAWTGVLRLGMIAAGCGALAGMLVLQYAYGFAPCPLCWILRGVLLLTVAFWLFRKPMLAQTLSFFGVCIAAVQFLEVRHSVASLSLCSNTAHSCVQAGSRLLLGYPIGSLSLAFFSAWLAAGLLMSARIPPSA